MTALVALLPLTPDSWALLFGGFLIGAAIVISVTCLRMFAAEVRITPAADRPHIAALMARNEAEDADWDGFVA